jgi:hypothetical protein
MYPRSSNVDCGQRARARRVERLILTLAFFLVAFDGSGNRRAPWSSVASTFARFSRIVLGNARKHVVAVQEDVDGHV